MAITKFIERGGNAAVLANRKKMKPAEEELLYDLEEESLDELAAEIQIEGGYKKPE